MISNRRSSSVCALLLLALHAQCQHAGRASDASAEPAARSWTFEQIGGLPAGWSVAATRPDGPLGEWAQRVEADGDGALALLEVPDESSGHFNLCWSAEVRFLDGSIEVAVLARDGVEDQGGGPMWRVQDAENYYVARYNPLESNFRMYKVIGGKRTQLAGRDDVPELEGWFRIRIEQRGSALRATLNGGHPIEAHDSSLPQEGGVGVWTKADARTSFDELTLRP